MCISTCSYLPKQYVQYKTNKQREFIAQTRKQTQMTALSKYTHTHTRRFFMGHWRQYDPQVPSTHTHSHKCILMGVCWFVDLA